MESVEWFVPPSFLPSFLCGGYAFEISIIFHFKEMQELASFSLCLCVTFMNVSENVVDGLNFLHDCGKEILTSRPVTIHADIPASQSWTVCDQDVSVTGN